MAIFCLCLSLLWRISQETTLITWRARYRCILSATAARGAARGGGADRCARAIHRRRAASYQAASSCAQHTATPRRWRFVRRNVAQQRAAAAKLARHFLHQRPLRAQQRAIACGWYRLPPAMLLSAVPRTGNNAMAGRRDINVLHLAAAKHLWHRGSSNMDNASSARAVL